MPAPQDPREIPRALSPPPRWLSPAELGLLLTEAEPAASPARTYSFGKGWLRLSSSDRALRERFHTLFSGCAWSGGATDPSLTVECAVTTRSGSPVALARFTDPEPLEAVSFCARLFEDRGFRALPQAADGWRYLAGGEEPGQPLMAARGDDCLFDTSRPWRALLGNLALNRVLRLQRQVLFLHAASASVGGAGVVLAGGKGAGKTTLSMALAGRGHGFLGDEMAAIDSTDWSLIPFRRTASVRPGPASAAVRGALAGRDDLVMRLPDGSTRSRVGVTGLFPESATGGAPLRALLFLRSREAAPRAVRLRPEPSLISSVPLSSGTLWEVPDPRRFLVMTRLLWHARCFDLHPGGPDETVDLIEEIIAGLEGS